MSTRGFLGFRINDEDIGVYNHSDSYPSWLGEHVLLFIKNEVITDIRFAAMFIIPSEVGEDEDNEDLIRDGENLLEVISDHVQGTYITIDNCVEFLADSLFCEWAYIINIDSGKLEVYKGFNKSPTALGRYAHLKDDDVINNEYFGVALVLDLPFDKIQSMTNTEIRELCNLLESNGNVELFFQTSSKPDALNAPRIEDRIRLLELR